MARPDDIGIDYPLGELLPPQATLHEVAPGVFWLRLPLPFSLDHINVWLLQDGDGWTLIDTGYGCRANIDIWQQLLASACQGRPLRRIIVTHEHPDHIGLAHWLISQTGAGLWMAQGEFLSAHTVWHEIGGYHRDAMIELYRVHGMPPAPLEGLRAHGNQYRHGVRTVPPTFHCIHPGDVLTIDGRPWRVIIGYGHSPEHVCLYQAELGVLISGDMLLPTISTNISVWPGEPDGDPLGGFLQSLGRLESLPGTTLVLPSHGRPFIGIQSRITQLRQHHACQLDTLRDFCLPPRTTFDCLPRLFARDLDGYQVFFAIGEGIAHLNHLWLQGELRRETGADGLLRFCQGNADLSGEHNQA